MDLFEAIKNRRSVRTYKPDPIPETVLTQVLDAARWAPSAGNCQPWEFIVVSDKVGKRSLSEAALGQHFIEEAPISIVVCANETRSSTIYGDRGCLFYCLLDAAAAVQNMLLAAYALGLGTCWVGAFNDDKVATVLALPPDVRPIAIIPLGYTDESPPAPRRVRLNDLIHLHRY